MRNRKVFTILVAFALFFICCKKNKSHPTDHTPKMVGMRHWHGTERLWSISIDSVIKYIDDTFSIVIVNNKEIITTITNNHLYYDDSPWDSVLIFSYKKYISPVGVGPYYKETIYYYVLSNRMIFRYDNPYPQFGYNYIVNLETP